MYLLHLEQKWDSAVVGTLAPFWYLVGVFQERWNYVRFWIAISISFVVHIFLIWLCSPWSCAAHTRLAFSFGFQPRYLKA